MKIKRYIEYIEDKHIVIEGMEFNSPVQVSRWLDYMGIENYTINEDLSVDVDDNVVINDKRLREIEVKFNIVRGDFWCTTNNLQTLENCPTKIFGNFGCSHNYINSCVFLPKCKHCYINHNKLLSLDGMPIDMNLNKFYCAGNILSEKELKWNWLESIISENESNISYHIDWIKENKDSMPEIFNDKFGYLLEFEHYTKTIKQ